MQGGSCRGTRTERIQDGLLVLRCGRFRDGGGANPTPQVQFQVLPDITQISTICVIPPFSSDHCTVISVVGKPCKQHAVLKTQWLYHEGDYTGLSNAIENSNWNFIEDPELDVDGAAQQFCTQFDSLLKTYIPTRQFYLRPNDFLG